MIEGLEKRIHCLGAGGAGMLPLALYLARSGHDVSAEDDGFSEQARSMLRSQGVVLKRPAYLKEMALVRSSAVAEDHPALAAARAVGSAIMRRGECLARIARGKRLIAVAGSHGKTTTCAMLIDLLQSSGLDPSYLLGAQFDSDLPCGVGESEWLVAEIDESDGTIDLFAPEVALVLNADHDHHARYPTEEAYLEAFRGLIRRTRDVAIVDDTLRSHLGLAEDDGAGSPRLLWVGQEAGSYAYRCETAGRGWMRLAIAGPESEGELTVNRSGVSNAANATFAWLALKETNPGATGPRRVRFRNVRRRQVCYYCSPELRVLEDYAHHPRELDALLERVAESGEGKLALVFQPHRYSRTLRLKADFARSLSRCDVLILLDVYAASESPEPGGLGEDLLAACAEQGVLCHFARSGEEVFELLGQAVDRSPATVLFAGAGIGDRLANRFAKRLARIEGRWGAVYRAIGKAGGFDTQIRRDEPLANKTTLRVGGLAERYFEPASVEELRAALKACHDSGIEVRPLGRGSNLLVPDEGIRGLVLRLGHPCWSYFEPTPDGGARVGAGLRIKVLCGQACRRGMSGYEFLEGIPGSLGGVLRMNAGAMGGWVFDIVESVRYVTLAGELVEASRDALQVGYRYCRELENAIAIEATLRPQAEPKSSAQIRATIESYQEQRRSTQPREPSAGCIFKNPPGDSAGRLIEELGLKGAVYGGAEISPVHGNFIINRGGATCSDALVLVNFIRRVARERKGVELEPEVLLFGATWQQALGGSAAPLAAPASTDPSFPGSTDSTSS